jgi:hypothetical protein
MYNILLKETDMIAESHFPVIALINEAFNSDPVEFVNNLIHSIGSGYNYASCSFWAELDDYDKASTDKFDGIMVNTEDGGEIVVSISDFVHYIEIACERLASCDYQDLKTLKNSVDALKRSN